MRDPQHSFETSETIGRVVAVCARATSGVPKEERAEVIVGPFGIVDDHHAGPLNVHKKSGKRIPNDRQISVVALEATRAVAEELGIELRPGALAENLLVEGLGELGDLKPGDRLLIAGRVELEVSAHNQPCVSLNVHHPNIVKPFVGRRGVLARVVQIGVIRPGDTVRVIQGELRQ